MSNTYKIFLASSGELKADRMAFEELIGRENKRLKDNHVFLHLDIWEDSGEAMSRTRSQDEYNRLLVACDLFVLLYWTKVGKYTNEEFDLARQQFLTAGKPLKIYTYRKTIDPPAKPSGADADSLRVFGDKLRQLEHFPIQYDSAEALQLHFKTRLHDLFADGTLVYGEKAKCLSAGQPAVPVDFMGREDELRLIRQRMDEGGTLMLINSEGGMGKTSIAAKYWTEHLNRYRYNAWLFCENGIVEEMKKLAPLLNLDLARIPEPEQVEALRTALQNLPKDCLLVLDNANNEADIQAFRQTFAGLHWHVLITSRCQKVLDKKQELLIEHLPPPLAKDLFTTHYREDTPEFEELLDRLLLAIGYNTLLIELFAKNMRELAAMHETLADFLTRLETGSLFLGERSFEVVTPYTTYVHKEAATTDAIIEILYDLTKLTEADRFRLVNLALLPAESHKLTLLIDLFAPDDKIALRNQVASLTRKGWLTTDTYSYRLSPVVQKIVLEKNRDTLADDAKDLVSRLNHLLETDGTFSINRTFTEAQPLAEIGLFVAEKLPDTTAVKALLYANVGICYQGLGLFTQSLSCFEKYAELSEAHNDRENVAISYSKLGDIYQAQGQFEQALTYFEKRSQLGEELYQANPRSESLKNGLAISYEKLGEIYQAQGQFEQALTYFEKDLALTEELYQANPRSVNLFNGLAISCCKLADLYLATGKPDQAREYFVRGEKIWETLVEAVPTAHEFARFLRIVKDRIAAL